MSFETVENVLNINTDAIMTLAMASILLLIGYAIKNKVCLLYTSPSPRDLSTSRMPSSA